MNYCESGILQGMLQMLELLSCWKYQFSAKTIKMAILNETLKKCLDGDMQILIA